MKDHEIEALIEQLETIQDDYTCSLAAQSLVEKIGTGNPKAIEALIKSFRT